MPNLLVDRLTEIYLWSMGRRDFSRIPLNRGWAAFLEGEDPDYPVRALRRDLEHIRSRIESMRSDPTTAETRLADWLLGIVPSTTDRLTQLSIGGYFSSGKLWALHSRLRYFDPEMRRAGLPEDVAALVERLTHDSVTVTLVNLDPISPRSLIVQAGGYREHEFTSLRLGDTSRPVKASAMRFEIAPGAGERVVLAMRRYAASPTLNQPWKAWTAEN